MLLKLVMPALTPQVLVGSILAWHKRPGDWVDFGEPILDVKVEQIRFQDGGVSDRWAWPMQIVSADAGYVIEVVAVEKECYKVGEVLAWFSLDKDEKAILDGRSLEDVPLFRVVSNALNEDD